MVGFLRLFYVHHSTISSTGSFYTIWLLLLPSQVFRVALTHLLAACWSLSLMSCSATVCRRCPGWLEIRSTTNWRDPGLPCYLLMPERIRDAFISLLIVQVSEFIELYWDSNSALRHIILCCTIPAHTLIHVYSILYSKAVTYLAT